MPGTHGSPSRPFDLHTLVLGLSRRSLSLVSGFALLLHFLAWLVADGFAVATEAAASLAVEVGLVTATRERQAQGDYAKSFSDYAGTRNSDDIILTGVQCFYNKVSPQCHPTSFSGQQPPCTNEASMQATEGREDRVQRA